MIAIEQTETWVSPIEIRDLFVGTEYGRDGYGADSFKGTIEDFTKAIDTSSKPNRPIAPKQPVEIDDDLGLAIVPQETLESKYGLSGLKDNSFVRSLREQFERKGFLSQKQVNCLR